MKILRVTPLPPEFIGGIPFYYKNISLNLEKEKNLITDIITPDLFNTKKDIEFFSKNVRIIYKKCHFYLANKNPYANIFTYLKKNYYKYDIIHAHGYYFFTTLQCALFKNIRNFPFILHIHGGIQTPYNPVSNISENFQLILKETIFDRLIGKIPIQSADRIISVAYKDLKIIRQKYKIDENISYYIPNGVDLNKFKRNKKINKKYITLLATRLSYIKGIDIYIDLIKELYEKNKALEFLIVGDGELKDLVFKAMKDFPIKYLSQVPYENIQDIYNMSKLLLITSRTEGIPNIIYESLACETPVISSNVGGISGVISNNFNGYLFEIQNYRKAIDIILNVIDNDQKLKELGKNGRELMKKNHSWKRITERIYSVYKDLLED